MPRIITARKIPCRIARNSAFTPRLSDPLSETAGMIETTLDLEWLAPWLSKGVRRVPETVRDLRCSAQRHGDLFFSWGPPRKMTPVEGYRIERTRKRPSARQADGLFCL